MSITLVLTVSPLLSTETKANAAAIAMAATAGRNTEDTMFIMKEVIFQALNRQNRKHTPHFRLI